MYAHINKIGHHDRPPTHGIVQPHSRGMNGHSYATSTATATAAVPRKASIFWHIQVVAGAVVVVAVRGRGRATRRRHPTEPRVTATLLARSP